jgi:hypothetical protein
VPRVPLLPGRPARAHQPSEELLPGPGRFLPGGAPGGPKPGGASRGPKGRPGALEDEEDGDGVLAVDADRAVAAPGQVQQLPLGIPGEVKLHPVGGGAGALHHPVGLDPRPLPLGPPDPPGCGVGPGPGEGSLPDQGGQRSERSATGRRSRALVLAARGPEPLERQWLHALTVATGPAHRGGPGGRPRAGRALRPAPARLPRPRSPSAGAAGRSGSTRRRPLRRRPCRCRWGSRGCRRSRKPCTARVSAPL